MSEVTDDLDRVVRQLDAAVAANAQTNGGDAIDIELAQPARTTAVRSVRDTPEVAAFRQELVDGLIRVDTANRLLRLVAAILERVG